jgi:hypothetical protein
MPPVPFFATLEIASPHRELAAEISDDPAEV